MPTSASNLGVCGACVHYTYVRTYFQLSLPGVSLLQGQGQHHHQWSTGLVWWGEGHTKGRGRGENVGIGRWKNRIKIQKLILSCTDSQTPNSGYTQSDMLDYFVDLRLQFCSRQGSASVVEGHLVVDAFLIHHHVVTGWARHMMDGV